MDDFKFEKGKFRPKGIEDLFGEKIAKKAAPQGEFERIEAGLQLRKKMADLCRSMATRLGKSLDAEGMHLMESQIGQLHEMFEDYKDLDVPL